jgi:cell wall-associated NlpC family hydrolase
MTPIDLSVLEATFRSMAGRVRYLMGAKAPSIDCDPARITRLDCSGWVRYAIHRAGGPTLPDGSVQQREWAVAHGLRRLAHYSDVHYTADDPDRLFLCFLAPNAGKAGHVWLVRAGRTMESCGGRGVCSRSWDTAVLALNADAAYELPARA